MFTPEGELRDEYRYLEEEAQVAGESSRAKPSEPEAARTPHPLAESAPPPEPLAGPAEAGLPAPGGVEEEGPGFFDLLGLLANPVPIYLEQARYAGPEAAEHLEMAKLHIELLQVVREKTSGNLDPEEQAAIEDVLYRLRMAFVNR